MLHEIVRPKYPSLGFPKSPMRAYARCVIAPTSAPSSCAMCAARGKDARVEV
jgi:hypothetical protein